MSNEARESPHPLFRVHLLDEATVVERGEQVKVWFLPWQDSWIRAKDHPAAELEEVSSDRRATGCPAGTIWQRHIELTLPPKTPLLCRVTRPLIESLRTVDYMTRDRKLVRRHVDELWYILVGNYRMTRSREHESFTRARREYEKQQGRRQRP